MKTLPRLLVIFSVLALGLSVPDAGDDAYANCGICKPMMAEKGLMDHLQWETHGIATGMLSVTTVDPKFAKAYEQAHEKMMANVERMEQGEKMELCPFCTRMTALAQAGAKFENLSTKGGAHILAVTSEDDAVVSKIHEHVEWAKHLAASHDEDHHGHDHGS